MTPDQTPLNIDDIIEVYISGTKKIGQYKVVKVIPKPNKVYYDTVHRTDPESDWSGRNLQIDSGLDRYFTWTKCQSVEVVKAATYPDGCICRRCNSRNKWAVPNQKDETYICYECR